MRKSDPAETRPGRRLFARLCVAAAAIMPASVPSVLAEPPVASYIFPAGGQRGTTEAVKVGGLYLNDACVFDLQGPGVTATRHITRTKTVWFEGPPMARPASSNLTDSYPQDFAGTVRIAATAPLGTRYWRVSTSQGTTALKKFVVGEFPEIVEDEIDGEPIPDLRQPTRDHQWTDFSARGCGLMDVRGSRRRRGEL